MRRLLLMTAGFLAVAGCARAMQPDGGPVPLTPPAVVSVSPDTFQILDPFRGPVRVEFERRISERPASGSLRDAVVVSPRTGEVEVSHFRRGIEISMEGGFREETVYQITVLPRLQDLFQNRMEVPVEFFFSTGPEFEPNVLAGFVVNRLTMEEIAGARVDARRLPDGPTHSSVSDSAGIFGFRYLPSGRYSVVAYEDLNRNRQPDAMEPRDSIEVEVAAADTLVLTDLALLVPDTTPAVVTSAAAIDSMAIEVRIDDHLDPDAPLDDVVARLTREDGAAAPPVAEVIHTWQWQERERAREAEQADEDAPPPDDPDAVDPDELEAIGEPDPTDDPILPRQDFVIVLGAPLEPGATYELDVSMLVNIQGVPGGGGTASFEVPVPEADPEDPPGPDGLPDAGPIHLDPRAGSGVVFP